MKRLFENSLKPFALSKSGGTQSASVPSIPTVTGTTSLHTTGLQPKYLVPPVPHPCPHDRLSLLAIKEGLLIRPYAPGLSGSVAHVRIMWGKDVRVEEITSESDSGGDELEWEKSVIVYGIIGILELFSGAYFPWTLCDIIKTDVHVQRLSFAGHHFQNGGWDW